MTPRARFPTSRVFALAAVVGAVGLLGAACSDDSTTPAAPKDNAQLVLGQNVFAANCTSCHGNDGGGISGPRLNDGRVVEKYPDEADQIKVVTNGRGGMPSFGQKLSDEDIQAVVAYTREVL